VILKPTAWVYWQAVENISDSGWGLVQTQFADGGPSIYLYDFAFQSSLMVQESVVSDQLRLGRHFYAMSHFSRFIKPGFTLLGGRYHYDNISYVSACTPTENEFVFVLVSGRSEETSINLNVETSKESSGVPQGTIYETHGASANLEVSRNVSISRQGTAVKISFQCKPQCIVTLVVLLF
jgi:O-glycosyl hydrolase